MLVIKKAAPFLKEPPMIWRGINLEAKDAAQERARQNHKKGRKEPGCDLLVHVRVPKLPVMVYSHRADDP